MKITKKIGKVYSVKTKSKNAKPKTVKVVINNCYGGFSLSPKAVHRLACRQGKPCYFFTSEYKDGNNTYIPVSGYPTGLFWTAFTVKDPENHNYEDIVLNQRPENRSDPDLIAVVKELKKEAGGTCAELKIIEVPADAKWHIAEYDGNEWVAEDHRTWS